MLDETTQQINGMLTLTNPSATENLDQVLRLQISISSLTWDSATTSYAPQLHTTTVADLGRVTIVPSGETTLPIASFVPNQPGIWRADFTLLTAASEFAVELPGILFSTYNWIVLGNETVSVTTDRSDAIYEVHEPVTFRICVEHDKQPIDGIGVQWWLKKDGGATLENGFVKLVNGEAHIVGSLDEPGFIQLRVTYIAGAQNVTVMAGAGIDPLAITPSLPVPDDFDAFWAEKKALLAAVPPRAQVVPVPATDDGIAAFDVQVDALGAPVSGYLALPADAQPKSLPAILTFHGAGVDSAFITRSVAWAKDGLLAFDINAHGLPNGQPASFYAEKYATELANYRLRGPESRETFYFLRMFLRVIRAIDYLTTRPEWDGRTLILHGTSQGGAQAYAGAGLDARVTYLVAGVLAMADLTGSVVERAMGWPGSLLLTKSAPEAEKDIMNTVRYFDTMNFATRVKVDGFFTVGFIDTTCPPTTVYAAYNNVKTDKAIYNDIKAGHVNTPEAVKLMREAVLRHVKKMSLPMSAERSASHYD